MELFARGGLAVLGKIEACGYNVWQRRPRLTRFDKARLMIGPVGRYRPHALLKVQIPPLHGGHLAPPLRCQHLCYY